MVPAACPKLYAASGLAHSTYITDEALEYAKAQGANSVISIGSGSFVGFVKTMSLDFLIFVSPLCMLEVK